MITTRCEFSRLRPKIYGRTVAISAECNGDQTYKKLQMDVVRQERKHPIEARDIFSHLKQAWDLNRERILRRKKEIVWILLRRV